MESSPDNATAAPEAHLPLSPLSRLHLAAEAAGITLLSSDWTTWQASYPFKCRHGHHFSRVASTAIHHGISCSDCRNAERLAQLQDLARSKGGECLETTWQGSGARHQFKCARGHVWQAVPGKVTKEGSWCRRCAQQDHGKKLLRKDGLAHLQDIAHRRGGSLLDAVYAGMHVRYGFSCAEGHRWQAQGAEIVRGSWCRACANANKRIEYRLHDGLARLQAAAQAKQGICLSSEYIMARTHYRFRCQHGHEWQVTGQRIFRGTWCPTCAIDRKRLNIDMMRQLAQQRGGQCLSEDYKNSATKLHWECHRGHQWRAAANTVLRGHWCAACAHFNQISNRHSKARLKYIPVRG